MRPFLLHIFCIIVLFSSCDWVKDDLSTCPSGTWIKITYTYNILDIDAATSQVGDVSFLAFDQNDKYVGRMDVDSVTLHQGNSMVKMPFPEGTYNFIVWGGAAANTYKCTALTPGITERKAVYLTLACENGNRLKKKLNAFFYSSLENVTINSEYRVFTADLMKNTNHFSCLLQDATKAPINQKDFTFELEAANGVMDCTNLPVDSESFCYLPYQQQDVVISESEQIPVVHARLNTLRLMKEDQTMLSIKHIPSGQSILHIPITQYLLITKIYNQIGEMGDQEYLDRQDSYTLLFFIESSESGIPKISPKMSINGWIVRLNSPELEDN